MSKLMKPMNVMLPLALSLAANCAIDREDGAGSNAMGAEARAGAAATNAHNDAGVDAADSEAAVVLRAKLNGADEVPVCTNGSKSAAGSGTIGIDETGTRLTVELQHSGLSGAPTLAHIHFGDRGVAGPVVLNLGSDLKSPIRRAFTAADYKQPDGGPADFNALVDAIKAGKTYFNLHTASCDTGEIRGQIGSPSQNSQRTSAQAGAPAMQMSSGAVDSEPQDVQTAAISLHAKLTSTEEVPLCAHGSREAVGLGTLAIDRTGTQLTVELQHQGLSADPTLAHIHFGDPGVAGPVVLALGPTLTSPIRNVLTAADYKPPAGAPADFAALVDAIKAGKTYFNLHTVGCGSGEIRGQIRMDEPTWSDAPSQFQTLLTPGDEVPVCSGASQDALGVGALVVSDDESQVAVALAYADLSGAPTLAHIHFGDPGVAGPVVLDFGSDLQQSPIRKVFSAADYQAREGGPATFKDLVAAIKQGHTYFNIHTATCTKGEIRGQID